jgi:hypothetical protein
MISQLPLRVPVVQVVKLLTLLPLLPLLPQLLDIQKLPSVLPLKLLLAL